MTEFYVRRAGRLAKLAEGLEEAFEAMAPEDSEEADEYLREAGLNLNAKIKEIAVYARSVVATDVRQIARWCWLGGNSLLEKQDLEKAVSAYTYALQLDPNLSGAHYNLGLARLILKRYEEALVELDRAEELDTAKMPDVPVLRGEIAKAQDNIDEALRQYDESLKRDPSYQPARQYRDDLQLTRLVGMARSVEGGGPTLEDGRREAKERCSPTLARKLCEEASGFRNRGDFGAALTLTEFAEVMADELQDPCLSAEVFRVSGLVRGRGERELHRAVETLRRSAKLFENIKCPRDAAYSWAHIAEVHIACDELDEAKAALKEAERLFAIESEKFDNTIVPVIRAELLWRLDNIDDAVSVLEPLEIDEGEDPLGAADRLELLGRLRFAQANKLAGPSLDHLQQAVDYVSRARVFYEAKEIRQGVAQCDLTLAQIHFVDNNLGLAERHSEIAHQAYLAMGIETRQRKCEAILEQIARARQAFEDAKLVVQKQESFPRGRPISGEEKKEISELERLYELPSLKRDAEQVGFLNSPTKMISDSAH